jgi:DNA-binding transcriptional regulator YiaG
MPSIGITSTDIAEPSNSTTEEFTTDSTVEVVTIRDKTGVTKHATELGYSTTNFTRRGRGVGTLGDVAAGAISEGTAKIISVSNTQTADDFPSYEITAVRKDDL